MALMRWPQPNVRAVIQPETATLWLFHWNLQPFTPPDAVNPLLVHKPAIIPKQSCDTAVTVPAKSLCQTNDRRRQGVLIISPDGLLALSRAVLADHTASPAFGDAKLYHLIDRMPAS